MGRTLAIDIETYSDVDLISCGVYKYSSSPHFEILLIAYSVDDEETVCIDVANGEEPPKEFIEMLFDDTVTKTAFNANFERTCFSNYYHHAYPVILHSAQRTTTLLKKMTRIRFFLKKKFN